MKNLLEQLINGLSTGSIYALIALGYTMVYGIAKMINFAHGDIIMVGAYALYVAVLTLHVPVIPGGPDHHCRVCGTGHYGGKGCLQAASESAGRWPCSSPPSV